MTKHAPFDFTKFGDEKPSHPGELLKTLFMPAQQLSDEKFAELLGATRMKVVELLEGKRDLEPHELKRLSNKFPEVAEAVINIQIARQFFDKNARRPSDKEKKIIFKSVVVPADPR